MHIFDSPPIQINNDYVLCKDGSIYLIEKVLKNDQTGIYFRQIAVHKKSSPKSGIVTQQYSQEFDAFWEQWRVHIRNTCSKSDSYNKWCKLTTEERSLATSFVEAYGKSSNEHNYLKRANTYLSSKIWESHDQIKELTKTVMPPLTNIAWSKEIYNQETGITETARAHVERFGMTQEEAWRLVNE